MLDDNLDLANAVIQRDLCTTRMSSTYNLVRSSLRAKRALSIYCVTYLDEPFLDENDWKFCREVEAILRSSKTLVTLSQTETKLNAAFAPIMRKKVHDDLTGSSMDLIDMPNWTTQVIAPRISVDVDTFSEDGQECRKRALLETERRFFGNRGDEVLQDLNVEAGLDLTQREKAVLVLDKRTCCRGSILSSAQWKDAVAALKVFYIEFYIKSKAYDRKKLKERTAAMVDVDDEGIESKNDIDAVIDDAIKEPCCDDDDMVIFDDDDMMERDTAVVVTNLTEDNLVELDEKAAGEEYDKAIKSWMAIKLPWRELIEVPLKSSEKVDPFLHLMNINMEKVMESLEAASLQRDGLFTQLIAMCKNSHCQLGALSSQSFCERMNSVANLVITKNRTKMGDELLHKLVVLHINGKFMEACRRNGKPLIILFPDLPNSSEE